jgi:hypothetical protein
MVLIILLIGLSGLFYFESSIDATVRQDLMFKYSHAWDMVLIIQEKSYYRTGLYQLLSH